LVAQKILVARKVVARKFWSLEKWSLEKFWSLEKLVAQKFGRSKSGRSNAVARKGVVARKIVCPLLEELFVRSKGNCLSARNETRTEVGLLEMALEMVLVKKGKPKESAEVGSPKKEKKKSAGRHWSSVQVFRREGLGKGT
jgi:hypothetical protein